MSRLLWSVGKLVNDPSTALYNEIRHRLFSQNDTHIDGESPNLSASFDNNLEVLQLLDGNITSTSRKILQEEKEPSSQYVQVGNGPHNRQVSIQCRRSRHETLNKSTSVPRLHRTDRGTGSQTAIKKDASTTPNKLRVCKEHVEVITALRNWPIEERSQTELVTKVRRMDQIKNAFCRLISAMKIEKIESIHRYRPTEKEEIRLYRCPSISLEVPSINIEKIRKKKDRSTKVEKVTFSTSVSKGETLAYRNVT
ncbi:unnamed protein product [Chrysodeixis includens]|uniref:Uncharacterized protein n=1 Tax=Chrysodeixis includens TaxID=689277 RepID=A0A9P0BUX4_CHRIL|nr:unnamed protein product [Chrysodeixis includens]